MYLNEVTFTDALKISLNPVCSELLMPAYCSFMFPTCIKHNKQILPVYLCREDCISVKRNYCNLDALVDREGLVYSYLKVYYISRTTKSLSTLTID